MSPGTTHLWRAAGRFCVSGLLSFLLWTVWLALAGLLAGLIYVSSVKELEVPPFLLRSFEGRLAASGLSVKFGRATFDPAGRLLIQDARIRLDSFGETVATARAFYVRLDLWELAMGRFEPREERATGVNILVPSMLSPSGRSEEIVEDLDADVSLAAGLLTIKELDCRLGTLIVSAKGAIELGPLSRRPGGAQALPVAQFISRNYGNISRELANAMTRLTLFDHPAVRAVFTPSVATGAQVDATIFAQSARWPAEAAASAKTAAAALIRSGPLQVSARFPLIGAPDARPGGMPVVVHVTADWLELPRGIDVRGLCAEVRGRLDIDAAAFAPDRIEGSAARVRGEGQVLDDPVARLALEGGWQGRLKADVAARLYHEPVSVRARIDWTRRTIDATFDALVSPALIDPVSKQFHANLRYYADFIGPIPISGRIRLSEGWKLAGITGRFSARNLVSDHVRFDEIRGRVEFAGHRLFAPEAYARVGDNFARGSFEQDFTTLNYRFLLEGRLRPLDISRWFSDWWPHLFAGFDFPATPPTANVDVRSSWRSGAKSAVYATVDTAGAMSVRGLALDRLRTRLFVTPRAVDDLSFAAEKGDGAARGSFTLATEPNRDGWRGLDLDAISTLDPMQLAKLLGQDGADIVGPFSFDQPPAISARAHFDGPLAPGRPHKRLKVDVRSPAGLRYYGIAFDRAEFSVAMQDADLTIDPISAGFAGGALVGSATVTGPDNNRRLRLSFTLGQASFGRAAAAVAAAQITLPKRTGPPAAPDGSGRTADGGGSAFAIFAQEKAAVRLDLSFAGEGRQGDPLSFNGDGHVDLQGQELGEISLLGGLSKLLKVTALHFTTAQSSFKLEGSLLTFPDLAVAGSNSAIVARGTYAIDARALDFNAKIYPFQESKSVLKLFSLLSTPLSSVFQVKLTGSLEKPTWSFLYSPLNLLRSDSVSTKREEGASGAPGD